MGNYYPQPKGLIIDISPGGYRNIPVPPAQEIQPVPRSNIPPPRAPNINPVTMPDIPPIIGSVAWKIARRHIILDIGKSLAEGLWYKYQEATEAQPAGWHVPQEWADAEVYICSDAAGVGEGAVAAGTIWGSVIGSHPANCLPLQAIAPGAAPNWVGFWKEHPNLADRYYHLRSYVRWNGLATDPLPEWRPAVAPQPALYRWINTQFQPNPQPWYDLNGEPATPIPVQPRPFRGKEKKFAVAIGGRLARAVNLISEASDWSDCLNASLPPGTRLPGSAGSAKHVENWYANLDKMDLGAFLTCAAANEAEDRFFGKLGRITGRANRNRGKPGGIALGPAL